MEKFFVLSAVGTNRPGIVAEVSKLIYECGCNLEDSRMTLLGSQFALMILLSGRGETVSEDLAEGCVELQREKALTLFLTPVPSPDEAMLEGTGQANYELRVVGLDRAGIVYRTSQLLASKAIDIRDLGTQVAPAPESGSPIFTMRALLEIPADVDPKSLRKELDVLADELHVEISLGRVIDIH